MPSLVARRRARASEARWDVERAPRPNDARPNDDAATRATRATPLCDALGALDDGDEPACAAYVARARAATTATTNSRRDSNGAGAVDAFERARDAEAEKTREKGDGDAGRGAKDSMERSGRVVPETEVRDDEAVRTADDADDADDADEARGARESPSISGLGAMPAPSPGVSVGALARCGNPFAHTPAWPKTQRTTPETAAAARRARGKGFMYLRDEDDDADAVTPVSRRRAPASAPGPSTRATAMAQSPFVIMQRHMAGSATPYANLDAPAPDSVTLTTASGKSVIARANGAIRTDEQPRFDDDDEAYEDAFTFRAAIETPATTRAESGGVFTSAAPKGLVFQTGGGASIAVSEDAKRRARAMFADVDENDPSSSGRERPSAAAATPPAASGGGGLVFQTAAGATLELSEAALKKSRAFLAEVGNENTPVRAAFPQPSFKTPKSLPAVRKAPSKAPGFTPPMKSTTAFTPPMSKLGARTAASAPRQAKRSRHDGTGASVGVAVHDLFAARVRMGMRAPLCTFFNNLLPFQVRPAFVDTCVATLNADTAKSLRLPSVERGLVGWREMRELMIKAGASDASLTNEWVANAYKWIVWTQACMARAFPEKYAFGVLSESAVLQRMLYKYEREINRAERPHVRRILEKDENPGAPAVYVVSAIRSMTTASGIGNVPTMSEIEISDGWYSVRARLDAKLTRAVREGRLRVGYKIFVVGAELRGVTDAVSPLSDDAEMAYVCLHVNGARLAPWDAALGRVTYNLTIPLRSVVPDGGVVPRMLIHVRHAYPMMHQERRDADKNVLRCEIAERRAHAEWQRARDSVLHELQDAMHNRIGGWGSEVDQERAIREALQEKNLYDRRTSAVLRLNVVGFMPSSKHESYRGPITRGSTSAILTIWDADEALVDAAQPGQSFAVTAIKPRANAFIEGELSLSTTRYTRWTPIPQEDIAAQKLEHSEHEWRCLSVRAAVDLADLSRSGLVRKEFDAVACTLHCGPPRSTQRGRLSQWIFCFDSSVLDSTTPNAARPHLLAVEITGYDDDSFVKADDWMPSTKLFTEARHECGPPLVLRNLEFQHYDADNGVYVARVPIENVSVTLAAQTPGIHRISVASRDLERFCGSRDDRSRSIIASLKSRARALTGVPENAESLVDEMPWDEVHASQEPASQYDPPRLSMDDDWNDENAQSLADEAVRLTRSASKAPVAVPTPTPRRTPRRSSRGSASR